MSKYTEEFKRNAIELMKQAGITKACKELKLAHCTIYRWCRELDRIPANESDDFGSEDMNTLFEYQTSKEQPQPELPRPEQPGLTPPQPRISRAPQESQSRGAKAKGNARREIPEQKSRRRGGAAEAPQKKNASQPLKHGLLS